MPDLEKLAGINIGNEVMKVKHSELERLDPNSDFKSVCPKCAEGVLIMSRDPINGRLLQHDICRLCGQQYLYTDIQ